MGEEGLEPSQGDTSPDFESGASAVPPLARKSGLILISILQNVKDKKLCLSGNTPKFFIHPPQN